METKKKTTNSKSSKETVNYTEILTKIFYILIVIAVILMANLFVNIIKNGSSNNSTTTDNSEKNTEYDVSMFKEKTTIEAVESIQKGGTEIVYIGRSTCGYCVKFLPVLQQAQKEFNYTTTYIDLTKMTSDDQSTLLTLDNGEPSNYIEKYTRKFNYPENSRIKSKEDLQEMGIKTFFCSNVCAAYKRNIYEKAGGFCKKTIFNEDMILAGHMINAGYKVAYVAEARVIHSHNYTGMQQFHRNFDMAVSQAEHPEVFEGIKSESEGIKLVKQTAAHLVKRRKIHLVPKLVYQSGCKYIGYRMGKMYKKLPDKVVKWCSMSPGYWEK